MEHDILRSAYQGRYLSDELDLKISKMGNTYQDKVSNSGEHVLPSSYKISASRE